MERRTHHDLVQRLVLHAGALAETFATDAARMSSDDLGSEAGRRLAEAGQSIALLTEAAVALAMAAKSA